MANANKFVSEGTVVEAEDEGGALAPDEDAEKRLDRAWYDDDEGGGAVVEIERVGDGRDGERE